MQHEITFGSRSFEYQLEYKDRKTLGIKVHPSGQVNVSAPLLAPSKEIKQKVLRKAPWIFRHLDRFQSYKPGAPPRRYISGETHLYLGRQYRLKIVPDVINEVKAYRGQLWILCTNPHPQTIQTELDKWYRTRAHLIYHELLEEILPRFRRYNIKQPKLSIRKMTKRWGSCSSKGNILLNTELIKAPKGCIEYVIIHELCHLVHRNHDKQFERLMNGLMPDWGRRKTRLDKILS